MADDNHVSSGSADHRDPDNGCRDTQLDSTEPNKSVNQPISYSTFPRFPLLPWELRRMVWGFALPRRVITSAMVSSQTYMPYPTISMACREAFLVVKEFGSMVTAWDINKIAKAGRSHESITDETDLYTRTWFSPKLDTITLDPLDTRVLSCFGEAAHCDLINSLRSPTTNLMVRNDWSRYDSTLIRYTYHKYLKNRDKVLLNIGDIGFVLKDNVWDIGKTRQELGAVGSGQVIHLNDTAALGKCLELWEHCCKRETIGCCAIKHGDIGAFLKMAMDEGKREGARGWMRTYEAWIGEDKAYEKRLVSPAVYFVLRLADHIMSPYRAQPNSHRGHELVDYTGKLKTDHPLVRSCGIKLPEIIPVFTIKLFWRCRCEERQVPWAS